MPNKYEKKGKVSKAEAVKGLSNVEANKREILKNLGMPSNKGLVSKAIEGVVSYSTYQKYRREDDDFKVKSDEVIEAMEETKLDKVEEKLIDAILDDDKQLSKNQTELVKMYLKTKGKNRGYTERQEIKQEGDGGQLQINYVVPKQIENIEEQDTIEIKGEEDGE
jgi:hypothetical protein